MSAIYRIYSIKRRGIYDFFLCFKCGVHSRVVFILGRRLSSLFLAHNSMVKALKEH